MLCFDRKEHMEALKLETVCVRTMLERFERSKILEVYFARVDGRVPRIVPFELKPLWEIELSEIKAYLLGQHPHDNILSRLLSLMN